MNLVSIEDARAHLRIDDWTDDDHWLCLWIPAVSQAVANWLKDEWRLYMPELDSAGAVVTDSDGDPIPSADSDGEYTVRPVVRAAVLLELASLYRFREGEGRDNAVTADAGYGYVLNKASTALLTPLRRPTVG